MKRCFLSASYLCFCQHMLQLIKFLRFAAVFICLYFSAALFWLAVEVLKSICRWFIMFPGTNRGLQSRRSLCIRHCKWKPLTLMNAAVYCFAVRSDQISVLEHGIPGEAENLQVMRQFYAPIFWLAARIRKLMARLGAIGFLSGNASWKWELKILKEMHQN